MEPHELLRVCCLTWLCDSDSYFLAWQHSKARFTERLRGHDRWESSNRRDRGLDQRPEPSVDLFTSLRGNRIA